MAWASSPSAARASAKSYSEPAASWYRSRVARNSSTVRLNRKGCDRRVRRARHCGQVDPHVTEQYLAIGDLQRVLFGVPGYVPAAATDDVIPLLRPKLGRHRREQHEVRRDPDVVEGVVAGLIGSLSL